MSPSDLDALVRRANAAGFSTVADYAASLETSLLKIATQGLGTWSQERRCMVDAHGEPWFHWATRAEMAIPPLERAA